jgi:hypothetical protein
MALHAIARRRGDRIGRLVVIRVDGSRGRTSAHFQFASKADVNSGRRCVSRSATSRLLQCSKRVLFDHSDRVTAWHQSAEPGTKGVRPDKTMRSRLSEGSKFDASSRATESRPPRALECPPKWQMIMLSALSALSGRGCCWSPPVRVCPKQPEY